MKLYKQEPNDFVRISIQKLGEVTKYITLTDTDIDEVKAVFSNLIKAKVKFDPLSNGNVTRINIREAIKGRNGRQTSISFRGLDPEQTQELILKHLNDKK